jgi:hypothetical protein
MNTAASVDAAFRYLTAKGALGKLNTPVPTIGRNAVWLALPPSAPCECTLEGLAIRLNKPNRHRSMWKRLAAALEAL